MTILEFYEGIKGNYNSALNVYKDEISLTHFIKMFKDDKSYFELIDAYNDNNYDLMISKAHTIKCLSNDLGFTNLYQKVALLLDDLRGEKLKIKDLIIDLVEEYDLIIQMIIKLDEIDFLVQ